MLSLILTNQRFRDTNDEIFFLCSRKESYEMDYCYAQDEDNGLIFSREIKPMISRVLNGGTASVIAYGARGSGKTYTIQVGLWYIFVFLLCS